MRPSISLFKKLKLIRCILIIASSTSCQLPAPSKGLENQEVVLTQSQKEKDLPTKANLSECSQGKVSFTLPVESSIGAEQIQVSVAPPYTAAVIKQESPIHVSLEGLQDIKAFSTEICTKKNLNTESFKIFHRILSAAHPECTWSSAPNAWRCKLATIEPKEAFATLSALEKKMFRSWKRIPYTISRRAKSTRLLARAITQRNEKNQSAFCKILKNSLKQELPLVFQSQNWQDQYCQKQSQEAGKVALFLAVKEVQFLSSLLESSSRLGILAVKLPYNQIPSKELWVELSADESVLTQIKIEAENHWKNNYGTKSPSSCRSFIFQDSRLLAQALIFNVASHTPYGTCQTPSPTQIQMLTQIIMGETQFVVSNGRGKILRLPKGSYRYTLRRAPTNLSSWKNPDKKSSSGSFNWKNRTPTPAIRVW